jgi:hypothetical protein
MSESQNEAGVPGASPEPAAEDERRARAAEINRKRTEEEWNQNKKNWLKSNFPAKTGGS